MKRNLKFHIPTVIIILSLTACLILTAWILLRSTGRQTDAKASSGILANAYITGTSDGSIRFLYDGESYEYEGTLAQDYSGIADIEIEDGKIVKLYTKVSSVSGTLDAYTDSTLCIDGYGWVSRNDTLACYQQLEDGSITEESFSDTVIGVSCGTFIFENGSVCAVILDEAEAVSDIRVLLKNDNSIFWDSVCLTADAEWTVSETAGDHSSDNTDEANASDASSTERNPGELLAVSDCFADNIEEICISCDDGLFWLCDADGNLISEGYEGILRIFKTSDGYVLVNQLPLEDYVRYVLPSEMPASFSFEALKAQAVCARTFACSQMKSSVYAQYGANLDDSTSYQVYNAYGTNETMDQAAADTCGQILTDNDELVVCYYYSTSPGYTNTTDVWENSNSPDYLTRRCTLLSSVDQDLSDEGVFTDFICSQPESYDSASPFYRWSASLNLANITDSELGTLQEITVDTRNASGYITRLICTYEKGSVSLSNENTIRSLLGTGLTELTLSDGSTRTFTSIPSACFAITAVDGSRITLTGGGFGHGIGMSQYGADAMGDAGWTYEEILNFYYTGTSIVKL